jgi:glutathione peroxidase
VPEINTLDGRPTTLAELRDGKVALVVNVASRCGLTPQYSALEELHEKYEPRGFTVIGVPCNQFGDQEPGSAEEIQTFCSTTYGVTFPMTEKIDVNGPHRHPVYQLLTEAADEEGEAGDVQWNFEKFLMSADGRLVARFRPMTQPDDPKVIEAIESLLG